MFQNSFNKEEDIMMPQPSSEQIKMWDAIETSLDEKTIEIQTNFHALADELRTHFASMETAKAISIIGAKHQFAQDKIQQLSYIAAMILLAETNIVDFVKTLQEKCGLKEKPARQLARDLNQEIFLPVKESLKKLHKVPEWPREDKTTSDDEPRLDGNVVDLKNEN